MLDLTGDAAVVPGARLARRLCARRPTRSCGGAARGAQGPRSRRHVRQAARDRVHRRALRAFALQDRRLPSLPRSLPGGRHRAGGRSRQHRPASVCRLRPMRRGLPDRRGRLRLAAADALMRKLRTLLDDLSRGGRQPIRSFCCTIGEHGADLIDALARHGDGLPANALPVSVNEVTQVGIGNRSQRHSPSVRPSFCLLVRARPRHDIAGLRQTLALAEQILVGLGFGAGSACPRSRRMIRTNSAHGCAALAPERTGRNAGELHPGRHETRRAAACVARTAPGRADTG